MKLCISLTFFFTLIFYSKLVMNIIIRTMEFNIQDKVKLIVPLSYLKTSDNMPMLRPPDLVAIDEVGEIISIKSPETVEIRFRRGAFLIDIDKIEKIKI